MHKTIFGALLSMTSFSLMLFITLFSLITFIYQKPEITSNIVFYINKKFSRLEYLDLIGKIRGKNLSKEQMNNLTQYFRIVFLEKNEFNEINYLRVSKFELKNNEINFKVQIPISNVYKDKNFGTVKLMTCKELKNYDFVNWKDEKEYNECLENYENYFSQYENNNFIYSFNVPIFSVDRKGNLQKTPHEIEFPFNLEKNKKNIFTSDSKFVVIEDDSNLIYSNIKYEAYIFLKKPNLEIKTLNKDEFFSLDINLVNIFREQVAHILIKKFKILETFSKLGGVLKIITLMKMTCKFWSSYFYESMLYDLVVTHTNPFFEEKKLMLEKYYSLPSYKDHYRNFSNDFNLSNKNNNNNENNNENVNIYRKKTRFNPKENYTPYITWFSFRFCRCCYKNPEAKRKREMLCDIFGLRNYLLHLDYIDREIAKERLGKINEEIKNFNNNEFNYISNNNIDNNNIDNNDNNNFNKNKKNQINSSEKLNISKDFSESDKTEENFNNI
jgi:hypothetical protein